MKVKDVDITSALRDALPINSFLFNPSIAKVTGDTYLVSVRSFKNRLSEELDDNYKLRENDQHSWSSDWKGEHDSTFILPVVITEDNIQPITGGGWPLEIPVQDMRLFRFMQDGTKAVFIITYNQAYDEAPDLIIKGGDTCDDWCYIIGWAYLIVDVNNLRHKYIPGEKPLCPNISNPIEKNWSVWRYDHNDLVYLLLSYGLTPQHQAFSFTLQGVHDRQMVGGTTCRMITRRPDIKENILGELETFYDNNVMVSLSTPAYPTEESQYQAVGHIKVAIDYARDLSDSSPLGRFAKKYMGKGGKKYYHQRFMYFMFLYRFKVITATNEELEMGSKTIQLTGSADRVTAVITHVTPAFVNKVDDYDYFLNFPSGMVINKDHTVISYGNGDNSSHLLYLPNDQLEDTFISVEGLGADEFSFLHSSIKNGHIML